MNEQAITALAQKYADKSKRAYDRYQETGDARQERDYQHFGDVAEALWIAVSAAEDHQRAVDLRVTLAGFSAKAAEALSPLLPEAQRPAAMEKALKEVAAYGRIMGVTA